MGVMQGQSRRLRRPGHGPEEGGFCAGIVLFPGRRSLTAGLRVLGDVRVSTDELDPR
jgi:hypothetical protein